MKERLQKILSRAGVTSRRAGEELVLAGRVRVNGQVVSELGAKADFGVDRIEVDGQRLVPQALRYVVLHKPRGMVSTLSDPEGRPTVGEMLGRVPGRLFPVGRLDFATSGVLLATNDGEFANGLLHPKGGVPKTYVVKTQGEMTPADLERWAEGVVIDDGRPTLPAKTRFLRHEDGKTWFEITLREGRNQQIRRMGEATGFAVMRLARIEFAGVSNEGLKPGELRSLTLDELSGIRADFGVPKRLRSADLSPIDERPARRPSRERTRDAADRAPRESRAPERGRGRTERETGRGEEGTAGGRNRRPHASGPARAGEARYGEARPEGARGRGPRPDGARERAPGRAGDGRHGDARTGGARPEGARERGARPGSARPGTPEPAGRFRAERSDRSETTPRGAAPPAARARGRGGR